MEARDGSDAGGGTDDPRVNFAVNVEGGETVITMRGDRDTAVIVRSESGERIYLPPEDFEREAERRDEGPHRGVDGDSPYQRAEGDDSPYQRAEGDASQGGRGQSSPYRGSRDSPYQGVDGDSPYQAARQQLPSEGLVPTADGYRIRHPEPVTDVRVLR
ncbi:DUF7510 family protein [Halobellus rufus]|uniref:DUF7510 family protein n=1 Tax=Halobellus rufus TaxID=1448860 RepID=UPI0006799123|nr:hypothetical protein [Halobellus rufus]